MSSKIDRRGFLKTTGAAAAGTVLAGCGMGTGSRHDNLDPAGHHTDPVPVDKMTYRTNPKTGERAAITGIHADQNEGNNRLAVVGTCGG